MSFYNDPIVDTNAKRSEESVNTVKSLFTMKNGFIPREEHPDYGVDFDVELVRDDIGATSKKFAIQIKSASVIKKTVHLTEEFIKYNFKTSRLGYLARRSPAYGLIVIYDESNQICYFDYVEDIISRLDNLNERDDWREQTTVNILLPIQQLNKSALKTIHQKLLSRHENSQLLIKEHGQKFNIPFLEQKTTKSDGKIDVSNPEKVAQFLEKYGNFLFNENEFPMLLNFLGVITKERLNNSSQLIFLAAITYTQVGNVIEAEYYIKKARKMPTVISGEGKGIIEFSEVRVEFLKGNMDYPSFLEKFKEIAVTAESIENKLTLAVNILYFEIVNSLEGIQFADDLENRIAKLSAEIEAASVPEQKKHLIRVYHSENQHSFAIQSFIKYYGQFKIKEALNIPVPMAERIYQAQRNIELTTGADKIVYNAFLYADKNELPLLKATAAHQMGKNFFTHQSTMLFISPEDTMPKEQAYLEGLFARNQNYSLIAYNIFLELHMFQNAHESLTTAYEINQISIHLTGTSIGPLPAERLLVIIREIETANDLIPFESSVRQISIKLNNRKATKTFLKGKTDNEILEMATKVLEVQGLPIDRLPNLIHDMNMVRTFEERVTNTDIGMLQNLLHIQHPSTHYASLPIYILRHQKLGIETKPSSDIEMLLDEFATIITSGKTE